MESKKLLIKKISYEVNESFEQYIVQKKEEDERILVGGNSPASNTGSKTTPRTITQEALASTVEKQKGFTENYEHLKPTALEMAGAVMDTDTGDLMEYRHLMKHPKYKEVWGSQLGTKLDD